MSTERGNVSRTRAQKHKNSIAFKNNLHGTLKENDPDCLTNLCDRCYGILEWRIKYKKYQALTQQKRCLKCDQKVIKRSYRMVCPSCSVKLQICTKCGNELKLDVKNDGFEITNYECGDISKPTRERERRTMLRANQTDVNDSKKSKPSQ